MSSGRRLLAAAIAVGLTLAACSSAKGPGYADGVARAEYLIRAGEYFHGEGNSIPEENWEKLCLPGSYKAPIEEREGYMAGCIDTLRSAN